MIFDVVPDIKLNHARSLLKMCPVTSSLAECMRYDFTSARYLNVKVLSLLGNIKVCPESAGGLEKLYFLFEW